MPKKIIHFKGNEKKESYGECNNIALANASGVIDKYWFEIIKDVFNYERERGAALHEVHKLFTDDRVLQGLQLFKEGKVKEGAVTDVDVRATVEGSKDYTVTMKNWKPEKLLRFRHEMEKYIGDMFLDCTCEDHVINGHYRNNSTMVCKHISAVLWKMQAEYNMPKFFVTPKEKEEDWYEKSKSVDLVKGLYGVSMKQFQQFLNVVVLREFKGIPPSLALSIHKEPNTGYEHMYPNKIPPAWITFTEPGDVEKIIKGSLQGYVEMLAARGNRENDIIDSVKSLFPFKSETEKDQKIKLLEEQFEKEQIGREQSQQKTEALTAELKHEREMNDLLEKANKSYEPLIKKAKEMDSLKQHFETVINTLKQELVARDIQLKEANERYQRYAHKKAYEIYNKTREEKKKKSFVHRFVKWTESFFKKKDGPK